MENKKNKTTAHKMDRHTKCHRAKPLANFTATSGFRFVFKSGAQVCFQKNQFALIAAPPPHRRCVRGTTLRECDGFKLLQLDIGDGNIMKPIDVERLANGENPIDAFYNGLDEDTRTALDAAVQEKTGQSTYVLTSICTTDFIDKYTVATYQNNAVNPDNIF